MRVKKIVGTAAALATLTLAGCGTAVDISGGQGASLTQASFGSAISAATSRASSVHINGSITVHGQHLVVSVDAAKPAAAGASAALAATISFGGLAQVQVRVVGGALYVNRAQLPIGPGAGDKPWVKIALDDSSQPFGALLNRLTASLRPQVLEQMFRSASTVTKIDTATIDDIATTHYKVSVDTSKVESILGVPGPPAGTPKVPSTVTYDVWVNGDNLPVMITLTNHTVSMNLQFSKWGEPVHVTAPPPSQVATIGH